MVLGMIRSVGLFFPSIMRDYTRDLDFTTAPDETAALPVLGMALLEAISGHTALIDEQGTILAVNTAWRRFTEENDGECHATGVGANYFDAVKGGEASMQAAGIHAVLVGAQSLYTDEYSCDSPTEQRWFQMSVRGFTVGGNRYAVVIHENITLRREAQLTSEENAAQVRAILETTVDAIITIDDRGRIDTFNEAAERLFGYKAVEVAGQNIRMLMPEPYRANHDGYMHQYLMTGHRKIIGIGREVFGQHKSGRIFPIDLAVSEVLVNGRRIFTGIIRDLTKQRTLEQDIVRAGELERQRISQEMHDGLGAHLTGLGLISQSLDRQLRKQQSPLAELAEEITTLIKDADHQARNIARVLMPVELEQGGFVDALERLARNASRAYTLSCIFEAVGNVELDDDLATTNLYRIAQEALTNAIKHGQADRVVIRLEEDVANNDVNLCVEDDGIGFPQKMPVERGIGLQTMGYRARMIGATLRFERGGLGGACVRCTVHRKRLRLG